MGERIWKRTNRLKLTLATRSLGSWRIRRIPSVMLSRLPVTFHNAEFSEELMLELKFVQNDQDNLSGLNITKRITVLPENRVEDSIAQACLTVTWFRFECILIWWSKVICLSSIETYFDSALWNQSDYHRIFNCSHLTSVAGLQQEGEVIFILNPQDLIEHLHEGSRESVTSLSQKQWWWWSCSCDRVSPGDRGVQR